MTVEQARQIASEFLAGIRADLKLLPKQISESFEDVDEQSDPNVGPLTEFSGEFGTVGVSGATGAVVSYAGIEDLDGVERKLRTEEAFQRMRLFLQSVYPRFDEGRFTLSESEFEEGVYRFAFEQKRLPQEVSIFHNFVAVSVRADHGRIVSYDRSDHDFVRSRPPAINESAARKLMASFVEGQARITELDLLERPVGDYTQGVTVWAGTVEANVGGLETLDMVLINADTGERVPADE